MKSDSIVDYPEERMGQDFDTETESIADSFEQVIQWMQMKISMNRNSMILRHDST